MEIKKYIQGLLLLSCVGVLSCSNFNESTSLGQDIQNEVDPTRTNFNANFLPFSQDTSIVKNSGSIASPNDTLIGRKMSQIIVGETDSSVSRAQESFLIDSTYKANHFKSTIKQIFFRVDTAVFDTSMRTVPVPVTLQLYEYTMSDFLSRALTSELGATLSKTVDSITDTSNHKLSYKGQLSSALVDSIKAAIKDTGKDTSIIGFIITSRYSTVRLYSSAQLIIERRDSTDTADVFDTLNAYLPNFVTFEKPGLKSALDPLAVTSSATGRDAFFALDLTDYWKTLDSKPNGYTFNQILSTTLSCRMVSRSGSDTISFRYFVAKDPVSDENSLQDSIVAHGKSKTINGGDSTALDIAPYLQRLQSTRPNIVYLYLSNIGSSLTWQETLWKKPSLTAVFTNTK